MQASSASKFDVLTQLDVRSKMLIAALAAVMTIALSSLNSQLLLFTTSLLYLFALGRYKLIFVSYAASLLMMALSVGFASALALFIPSMGKSLELSSLCIPFLRALTVMNTILPMAFTGRLQNILKGLQQLKLPFIIYLPAAVIIRFIPTFAGDVKQIWESLKIRGFIHGSARFIRFVRRVFCLRRFSSERSKPATSWALQLNSKVFMPGVIRVLCTEADSGSMTSQPLPLFS